MKCEICENPPEATHVVAIGDIVPVTALYLCESCLDIKKLWVNNKEFSIWAIRCLQETVELEEY